MSQEDKELLLKDLCARLPYGVKTIYKDIIMEIFVVSTFLDDMCCLKWDSNKGYYNQTHAHIGEFKPYLRPMSSMTDVEKHIYDTMTRGYTVHQQVSLFDWLNSHHFDYRGLIPTSLALEAPEGMYKID